MNMSDCENIVQAALARMDGETHPLPDHAVQEHLKACPRCREEIAELRAVLQPLNDLQRSVFTDDLWPNIETALVDTSRLKAPSWYYTVFFMFGLILVGLKVLEVYPTFLPSLLIKLLSLLVPILLFLILKENPLRIRDDLYGADSPVTLTQKEKCHVLSAD